MRNLNLDQLQTLIAIADLGTFAAASQALHLAPPTVSLHIKELESRMQAALLVRGRKQAELTAAGSALVQEGRKLLSACDELVELVQRRAAGLEAVVKIGVSAGVNTRLLPDMLGALTARHAGIEVKLERVGSARTLLGLKAGTLDVGIVARPAATDPELHVRPWRSDTLVALVPASWKPPARVTPAWLSARRWACFEPGTQMHGLIASWFGRAGLNPRPFLTLSYPGALTSLVVAGQSAAILPLEEVESEAPAPGVEVRHLRPGLKRPMVLAWRKSPPPGKAAATVLEVLGEFAR